LLCADGFCGISGNQSAGQWNCKGGSFCFVKLSAQKRAILFAKLFQWPDGMTTTEAVTGIERDDRRTIMKALSVKQPWASMIECKEKTIETRTWHTEYRGDLLIVASKKPDYRVLAEIGVSPKECNRVGCAVCIVSLVDCRPMTREDEMSALCEVYKNAYAWVLDNIRPVKLFPVKGQLGLFEVEVPDVCLR
jgi:hypothetical protein